MAVIGGFRYDLSITRKTGENFGNVSTGVLSVFCFPKSRINENGGNKIDIQVIFQSFLSIAVLNLGQCHLSLKCL